MSPAREFCFAEQDCYPSSMLIQSSAEDDQRPSEANWSQLLPGMLADRAAVESTIRDIIKSYECCCILEAMSGTPKGQKARLGRLIRALSSAAAELRELPPDYAVAIAALSRGGFTPDRIPIHILIQQMLELARGADEFLEVFEPPKGRPLDVALYEAVRALLKLIEGPLCSKVRVRWNKRSGRPPEPASDGAKLLIAILRTTARPPTPTAVFNMVRGIKEGLVPAGPSHLDAVFRAHFDELDASLLPNRHAGKMG